MEDEANAIPEWYECYRTLSFLLNILRKNAAKDRSYEYRMLLAEARLLAISVVAEDITTGDNEWTIWTIAGQDPAYLVESAQYLIEEIEKYFAGKNKVNTK